MLAPHCRDGVVDHLRLSFLHFNLHLQYDFLKVDLKNLSLIQLSDKLRKVLMASSSYEKNQKTKKDWDQNLTPWVRY